MAYEFKFLFAIGQMCHFFFQMSLSLALIESYFTSLHDECHNVWLTSNCQWQSGFFLSWTRARIYLLPLSSSTFQEWWPMFLCERTWLQHQAAHPSLSLQGLLGPLRWQRHSSWGWGLLPAGCLAACLPLFLRAQWTLIPSSDTVSQGRVSRYTSLPPTIILPL